jgi:hypothetical protein
MSFLDSGDFDRGCEVTVGERVGVITEQFNSLSVGVVFASPKVDPADREFGAPKPEPFYWTVLPWKVCSPSRTLSYKQIVARLDWFDSTPEDRKAL